MRDLAIKDDDLIVATHGRGFWILDNITPLRQIDANALMADAILFKPQPAVLLPAPDEQGTPIPKDEPFAENAPWGAIIDYYVKAAPSGPVMIEIADASGAGVRRYSSDDKPAPRDPNTLSVQTVWAPSGTTPPVTAGMHRWLWDFRPNPQAGGGRGRGAAPVVAAGSYTVKLTAGGRSFTQPLIVKKDPRSAW